MFNIIKTHRNYFTRELLHDNFSCNVVFHCNISHWRPYLEVSYLEEVFCRPSTAPVITGNDARQTKSKNKHLLAVATWRPSSELATDVTSASWNWSADVASTVGFHRRTVLSSDPEQTVPSLVHATVVTLSECPVRQHSSLPCCTATNTVLLSRSKSPTDP